MPLVAVDDDVDARVSLIVWFVMKEIKRNGTPAPATGTATVR